MRTRLKKAPAHEEVSLALGKLLSADGVTKAAQEVNVAAVSGTRRPAYHLLLPEPTTRQASELLTAVLARSFSSDTSGWLIDLREARAIIEAAHRLVKAQR